MVRTSGKNTRRKNFAKKKLWNIPVGKRAFGMPRKRWLYTAENDMKKTGVRGWKKRNRDRDAWK